jgi:hypothetical protein
MLLAQYQDEDGYLHVTIGGRPVAVHVLVTEAFIGPCPPGMERLHGLGGQQDNSVTNLRFGTHQENEQDKTRQPERLDWIGTHRQFPVETSVAGGAAGE